MVTFFTPISIKHVLQSSGNLGNEALLVTRDDEVYALGSNGAGCLGLGDMHSTLQPKQVEPLCYKGVVGFAYGSGPHVLAYTENLKPIIIYFLI